MGVKLRFLRTKTPRKTCLVISDLHLGAGYFYKGNVNNLEDFNNDQELVQFFNYYSCGNYKNQDVEIVINGDFIDFLAVPYVSYFDDKFWSDEASIKKLDLVLSAHKEVFLAMKKFISIDKKKITYIVGNHDAELHMKKVANHLVDFFDNNECFKLIGFDMTEYRPFSGVVIKHGHSYDVPNDINVNENFFELDDGSEYFVPPWGSYYVAMVINRFKVERRHVASVRPIKRFIINGLIYDFYFTCRFILANIVYYSMVRFIYLFKTKKSFQALMGLIKSELHLNDGEVSVSDYFDENENDRVLVTGHTHKPEYRQVSAKNVYINTGTWTNMHNLDFASNKLESTLTYAVVESLGEEGESIESNLQAWKGINDKPFIDFT
jgi:UDP-2,3-diacylglucosamine pyrophosphatase LpxH